MASECATSALVVIGKACATVREMREGPSEPACRSRLQTTLSDITRLKHLEQHLQETLSYAQGIVETVREPLMVLNSDLKVQSANRSFYQTFQTTPPETEGRLIYDLGNGQWDIPQVQELLEEIVPQNTVFENFEVEHDFSVIGVRTMILNARRLEAQPGHSSLILLAMEDVTKLT